VKTLAHELAHAVLHGEPAERGLMELEAESVAFVVCHALGIASDDWTFGYGRLERLPAMRKPARLPAVPELHREARTAAGLPTTAEQSA
jgi:hypothetical protein